MIYEQYHHRSDDSDNKAVEVKAHNLMRTEERKQPAPDKRSDNSENGVEDQAAALVIYDPVGDEAGNQSQNDPRDDRHDDLRLCPKENACRPAPVPGLEGPM
jgi:hypothetical protein